jgi:hypothetical protein
VKEDFDPKYKDWDQKELNFAYMIITLISVALIAKLLHYCSEQFVSSL